MFVLILKWIETDDEYSQDIEGRIYVLNSLAAYKARLWKNTKSEDNALKKEIEDLFDKANNITHSSSVTSVTKGFLMISRLI